MIVSELLNTDFEFVYGGGIIKDDMWKLRYVDDKFNVTNINTPSIISFRGYDLHVVAECSGFLIGNKISYIIGAHTKKIEDNYTYFFVKGDFDYNNKNVYNLEIIADGVRSAFINKDKIYAHNHNNNNIYLNGDFLFDANTILPTTTIRIMGVYGNDNEIIITGINNHFESYLLNVNDLSYKKILNKDGNSQIYKSSILVDGDNKLLAYTDKIFNNVNNLNDCSYYLYYDNDFILE